MLKFKERNIVLFCFNLDETCCFFQQAFRDFVLTPRLKKTMDFSTDKGWICD